MQAEKLEGLLRDLGFSKIRVVSKAEDTNIMVCCPFHGERNPSCGISAEKEIGACFSCGKSFTLAYLVAYMKECSIIKAKEFLEERFNVSMKKIGKIGKVKRYDDADEVEVISNKKTLPHFKLAPFKSGKVCHNYLLSRGFTKETCREFLFGWDNKKKRISIPIFWDDESLCGFIGRAVLEPKVNGKDNAEYKKVYGEADKYLVYEFEKSHILYPLNKFVLPPDKTAILVEGSLDSPWMYQLGFNNTLSLLGSKISDEQINILSKLGVKKLVLFLDNDKAGFEGKEKIYKLAKHDFICYDVEYPEGYNDPQNLCYEQVISMLKNKKPYANFSIKRVE